MTVHQLGPDLETSLLQAVPPPRFQIHKNGKITPRIYNINASTYTIYECKLCYTSLAHIKSQ